MKVQEQIKKSCICIYSIAKDKPKQGETLKPRPSYRVWTNKLHYVCHENFGLFDNFLVSQPDVRRAWPHPV